LAQPVCGAGERVESGGGGRSGLGRAGLVPGGDVASAERRQGTDGRLSLSEGQLGDDGGAAPGRDQGQHGGDLDADVPGRDGDIGLGREPPEGMVAGTRAK
jgi:hypothetical protein